MIFKQVTSEVSHTRKRSFLPQHALVRALVVFGLCTLPLASGWAMKETSKPSTSSARKQIYALAVEVATADINREAKRKNWKDFNAKMNVFIPSEVSSYRVCSQPLQAALPTGDKRDLSRLRYDIRCEDANGWEVDVTVKPDIYLPVIVAKNTLERGAVISPSDIELKKRNISSSRAGVITNPDEVVGLTVKRRIRDLQPISPAQLDQPIMVDRGQRVVMIAEQDGIEARTMGEAMKKGRKGDMIKVKNESSQRVVSAVVDNMGVVRMLYAPRQ